jgi:hypothetical protein
MEMGGTALAFYALGAAALAALLVTVKRRLGLSKAKHGSLAGHPRMARRIASLVPFYEYDERRFFCSDNAPGEIAARRRDGFMRLSTLYETRFGETNRRTAEMLDALSDLRFTQAYRVPFQYRGLVRRHLQIGAFVGSSAGVTVTDLDGNAFYDLTGSYGVNLLGYDCYKGTMERGLARVGELGPVLARLFRFGSQRSEEIAIPQHARLLHPRTQGRRQAAAIPYPAAVCAGRYQFSADQPHPAPVGHAIRRLVQQDRAPGDSRPVDRTVAAPITRRSRTTSSG